MNNMKKFQKLLSASAEEQSPYLRALTLFTRLSPVELTDMTSGLDWQMW